MLLIVVILGGAFFLYSLIYKPELAAVVFFTLSVADINVYVSGISIKAILSICVFFRILIHQKEFKSPSFFLLPTAQIMVVFFVYMIIIALSHDGVTSKLINKIVLNLISAICAFHFYFYKNSYKYLKTGFIIGGLICVADLAYTYIVVGDFPVQRIYQVTTGLVPDEVAEEGANHNFFGYICGITFMFLLGSILSSKKKDALNIVLLTIMFLGVLMSTSRSSLIMIFALTVWMMGRALKSKEHSQKALRLISITIGSLFLGLFLFGVFGSLMNIDSDFIDKIMLRLIEEPLTMLNKSLGYNYDVQSLDSMQWREEATQLAYSVYMGFEPIEQIFGIGYGGFMTRGYGHGYNAHNGILLMLIEEGIIGFVLYLTMIVPVVIQSIRLKNISSLFVSLLFILFFASGNNNEFISVVTFLIVGALLAENKSLADNGYRE